jgi:hypothetical protein
MKVVINQCHGGFGLSKEAFEWLMKNKGWTLTEYSEDGRGYKDPEAKIVKHPSFRGDGTFEYYMVNDRSDNETRTNPDIIEVVKKLKKKANGMCASLGIVEIPDNLDGNWEIGEYDGSEWVQEVHRRWS